MRTVVNIRTGGQTKIAGMLHALLLFATVVSLAPLASQIPHAVLAGILIKTGWDIIDVSYLKRAHRGPRWDLALMALVLGLTVFVDLITAVAAGVVLASLAFVKRMADKQLESFGDDALHKLVTTDEERKLLEKAEGHITLFDFGGPLSFGAAADLGVQVRERTKNRGDAIILDFAKVPFLDVSAARAVETIVCDGKRAGKTVYVTGMNQEVKDVLAGLEADHCLPANTTFEQRIDALQAAVAAIPPEELHRDTDDGATSAAAS